MKLRPILFAAAGFVAARRLRSAAMNDVTRVLSALEKGNPLAADELLPLVYDELRRMAARKMAQETPGQTLEATALVHEAYVRLVDTDKIQNWNSRGHFFSAAAEAMRRILIERARHKKSLKAGGEFQSQDFAEVEWSVAAPNDDILALNDALENFERQDPRAAALVKLRFFAGLTTEEAAQALDVSTSTAENDWAYARSWLRLEVEGRGPDRKT
jgi:RNA polymerase sigma factor (TIGR02999 family)